MDTNGNAVAAFQNQQTNVWWHAYQEGLGWLGCVSAQGFYEQPGADIVPSPAAREKTFALTPHEIIGIWEQPYNSGFATLDVNVAPKDVRINTNAMQTASAIANLYVVQPFDNVCSNGYTQMRFSSDGATWSAWEASPSSAPYTKTKTGWDLTNPAYGGNSSGGLKHVYIQFKSILCSSIVTDDEILYTGGSAGGSVDIGLRAHDGVNIIKLAAESGTLTSPFRISKNGTNYGIVLVPTNSPDASKFRIQTASGTKSLMKLQ